MELVRRSFLTEAGESLLLARSAVGVAVKYGDFFQASGLTDVEIISDPIVSVPFPRYAATDTSNEFPWSTVHPEMLWHPLFWLPTSVTERFVFDEDGEDGPIVESDEMWLVRIALMVMSSGLYDVETGGWLDMLSTAGLDADNDEDCDRVARWQDGAADAALDAIDLSDYFTSEDRSHALETSIMVVDELRPASWSILAADLHSLCAKADEMDRQEGNPAHIYSTIRIITGMCSSLLSDVPDDNGEGSLSGFWTEQENAIQSGQLTQEEILDGPLATTARKLDRIVNRYADSREILHDYFTDAEDEGEEARMF